MTTPLDTKVLDGIVTRANNRIGGPSGRSATSLILDEIPKRIKDGGLRQRYFDAAQRRLTLMSAEARKARAAKFGKKAAAQDARRFQ